MSGKSFYLIFFFFVTFSGSLINAQQYLTLEDCRKLAIDNNKALKIASEEEKLAYYQKKEALMNFFPKISGSGTYLHFSEDLHLIGKSAIPSSISIPGSGTVPISPSVKESIYDAGRINMSDFWNAGFSLTQPIFQGGKIIAYHDLRSYAESLAKTMKETQMTDVIVEVDEAYWQVVSLSYKQKLAQSYVDLLTKMDTDIEAMYEEGVTTKADRLSVKVKLNEAEMTLTKADNGVSLSKMLLCQLCGLEISDKINLADENTKELVLDNRAENIEDIDDAISKRSEIRSLDLSTKMYKKQEKIAFSEFLPSAGLSLGYNWLKPNLQDGSQRNFKGSWLVAVQVKVPLNFITSSAKFNAAKVQTRIKQYELAEMKEQIKLQINQSIYKLTEANKKLIAASKNTEKADENLRYANVGFEEGVISASDALSAHSAWISAHAEKIDAQIDVKLCRIYLDKALGRNINN